MNIRALTLHESVSAETLSEFKRTIELHESCFGLGKYCVIIHNASQFIERCKVALQMTGLNGSAGLVDYFDERSFHGAFSENKLGFQKRSLFSHQREYRIRIDTKRVMPGYYILDVGDLSDIAKIMTPKEFNEQLVLKLPNGSHA